MIIFNFFNIGYRKEIIMHNIQKILREIPLTKSPKDFVDIKTIRSKTGDLSSTKYEEEVHRLT